MAALRHTLDQGGVMVSRIKLGALHQWKDAGMGGVWVKLLKRTKTKPKQKTLKTVCMASQPQDYTYGKKPSVPGSVADAPSH